MSGQQRPHGNHEKIAGYCPMGCGQTLFVGNLGAITCSHLECPCPEAVHTILSNAQTEHVVVFTEENFSIKHPLRERVGDELHRCPVHKALSLLDEAPVEPGTYQVEFGAGAGAVKPYLQYTRLADA